MSKDKQKDKAEDKKVFDLIEGLTPIDPKALADFKQEMTQEVIPEIVKVVDTMDRGDELEGFSFLSSLSKGVAVTSSRTGNVNFIDINW